MADKPSEKAALTVDDLIATQAQIEIINGEIVEMQAAGLVHHMIGGNIYDSLKPFALTKGLGFVFFDGLTYLMFSDAKYLKDSFVPDVSFIRAENMLTSFDPVKPYPGIPDLAIEVVSPGDDADDIQTKLQTYLAKGTEQVWIIYPSTREVYQYRRDRNPYIHIYAGSQTLDTEALFPGLSLTTDQIFSLPPWATKQD